MSIGGSSTYDEKNRLHLIVDALVGAVNYYPISSVSIFPLIDIIKLLVQQPLIFSFFDENKKLLYCTMDDPQYTKEVHSILDKVKQSNALLRLQAASHPACYVAILIQSFHEKTGELVFKDAPKKIQSQYKQLFAAIQQECDVVNAIYLALKTVQSASCSRSVSEEPPRADSAGERYSELISPLRAVLDSALGDLVESPLLHNSPDNKGRQLPYPNIFFVVQNATACRSTKQFNFNYTAQIVLSNTQKSQIEKWCTTTPGSCCSTEKHTHASCLIHHTEEAIQQLEQPLGKTSRSISDSVFCSGSIEFSPESAHQGRDHAGRGDSSRQKVEECIYAQIVDGHPKALLIPIHIGGVPWITLYTFTSHNKDNDSSSWKHNYHIYRTITRSIATRLRTGVKQLYLDLVSSELECTEHYLHGALVVDEINKSWEVISSVYPFDRVIITSETDSLRQSTSFIKSKHASTGYYLHLVPNEWYHRQIVYSGIQLEDVHQACLKALKRADDTLDEGYKIFSEQVKQQAHTLGNILHPITMGLTNLQTAMLKPRLNKIKCHNKFAKISTLVDVWIVSFQILVGNKNEQPQMLEGIKTLRELLDWFALRYNETIFGVIYQIESDADAVLPDVAGAFTILWNFIENARNNSRTPPVELHAAKISGGLIEIVIKIQVKCHKTRHKSC